MLGFKLKNEDNLFNRRRFMVLMTVYAVIWGFAILVCDLIFNIETGKVLAYLGYISTLSGAGLFAYFGACKTADCEIKPSHKIKKFDNSNGSFKRKSLRGEHEEN